MSGKVVLLRVIEPVYKDVEWLGVAEIVRGAAREEAEQLLAKYVDCAKAAANVIPETIIREGEPAHEIFDLVRKDEDIAVLVLAAGSTERGPGPLISDLARTAGTYPLPIAIVPAHLTEEELDALS